MVEQLAMEYAGQPVVFIESDALTIPDGGNRISHFWQAYGGGGAYYPLALIDGGYATYTGPNSTHSAYAGLIDAALTRPPLAALSATWERVGNNLQVVARVTNQSGVRLGVTNQAQVHAVAYVDEFVRYTGRWMVGETTAMLSLANGATTTVTLAPIALSGVDWSKLHVVVMADYQPSPSTGASENLQAAFAVPKSVEMNYRLFLAVMRK